MNTNLKKRLFLFFCLLLLYTSWGSFFIISKLSLENCPPILLSALRILAAGTILLFLAVLRGENIIFTKADITRYGLLGFFMVVLGSAFMSKSQEWLSSGMVAIISGIVPLWMVLADWAVSKNTPSKKQMLGLFIGFMAMASLHWGQGEHGEVSIVGLVLLFFATWGWVIGSFISKKYNGQASASLFSSTGFMMLFGGVETLVLAFLLGESPSEINWNTHFIISFSFLVFFSSIVGYISYLWLLYNARPIVAVSYEYVNPIIAVYLGWLIADERVDMAIIGACVLLISSVFLVLSHEK